MSDFFRLLPFALLQSNRSHSSGLPQMVTGGKPISSPGNVSSLSGVTLSPAEGATDSKSMKSRKGIKDTGFRAMLRDLGVFNDSGIEDPGADFRLSDESLQSGPLFSDYQLKQFKAQCMVLESIRLVQP